MFDKCPGASFIRTPTLKIKKCPQCGGDVEVFSNDVQVKCEKCGFTVYNDVESCIQWCQYARYCVGEELYNKLKKKKIIFVGVENSCRSQMAEALAQKAYTGAKLIISSAGTAPQGSLDPMAQEVLRAQESINWQGKTKDINRIGPADVLIVMEPMEFSHPGARIINWEIPRPNSGELASYRQIVNLLREKIGEFLKEAI